MTDPTHRSTASFWSVFIGTFPLMLVTIFIVTLSTNGLHERMNEQSERLIVIEAQLSDVRERVSSLEQYQEMLMERGFLFR